MNLRRLNEQLDNFGDTFEAQLIRPRSYLGQLAVGGLMIYGGEKLDTFPVTAVGIGLAVGGAVIAGGEIGLKLMNSAPNTTAETE